MTIIQVQSSYYIEELNTKFPNLHSTLPHSKQTTIVEAFLYNYPLPKIVLLEIDYNQYELIEGLEIVAALLDFYKGKFRLDMPTIFNDLDLYRFMHLDSKLRDKFTRKRIPTIVLLYENEPIEKILKLKNKLVNLFNQNN